PPACPALRAGRHGLCPWREKTQGDRERWLVVLVGNSARRKIARLNADAVGSYYPEAKASGLPRPQGGAPRALPVA
ncbi:MAG: hypothetical protein Q4G03_10140, partial [Planctomycetia bacterium]|nr:hypothetical protein [Planctomycetia bacterium]